MKRLTFSILICNFCLFAYSQHEYEIKKSIEESLINFFSLISDINDNEEPIQASTLASAYKGEQYFNANGKETTLEQFLVSYSRTDLRNNIVNHTLNISTNNITKISSNISDRRWTVKATLKRESATEEDYLIKDEDATFIVRWNGLEKEVSILEMNFSTPLKIVRPVIEREYKFEVDKSKSILSVPYSGGNWIISVQSLFRDVKSYPGVSGKTTYSRYYLSPFTYSVSDNINVNASVQSLSGTLPRNNTKYPKYYIIRLIQTNSGKSTTEKITVGRRPPRSFFYYHSSGGVYHQVDLFYSLKNIFGLSYMGSYEHSRFSLGFLLATNLHTFRDLNSQYYNNLTKATSTDDYAYSEVNGYKVTKQTINPTKRGYSDLIDPYKEAKHYTSRIFILTQGGFNASQWLRLDLGLGIARERNFYSMENAYSVDIYKYEKMSDYLPDIDDLYVYTDKYTNYYYKDKEKWGFAIRPAVNFHIPLDTHEFNYLTFGTGYTFVNGIKNANSLDFSLGIRWYY